MKVTENIPHDKDDELSWLALQWEMAVGGDLASVTRVERVAPKTLTVEVAGEAWIPSLKALEPRVLNTLNGQYGKSRFTRIQYREAAHWEPRGKASRAKSRKPEPSRPGAIMEEESPTSEGLEMIQDDHLRQTLARIARHIRQGASLLALVVLLANCASLETTNTTGEDGTSSPAAKAETAPTVMNFDDSWAVNKIQELKNRDPKADLHDPRSYYHYLMGLQSLREAHFDQARDHFEILAEHEPEREDFARQLAMLDVRTGHLQDAMEFSARALERFPQDLRIRMIYADVLAVKGKHDEALEQYQKIFDQDPRNARAKLMAGDLLEKINRPHEAIKAYRDMTVADPHNPLGFFFLGRVLEKIGRYEEAEKELNGALNLRPSLFEARRHLARVMEKQKHYARALEQYKILMKTFPTPELEEHYKKVDSMVGSGGDPTQELPPLEVQTIPLHSLLGAVYYEQAAYLEALDEFRLALAEQNDLEIRLIVSKIYEVLGRVDLAIKEVETFRAASGDPDRVDLLLNLARLYGMDEQMDKSVGLLESALEHEPRNDRLYHSLALAHMALSQYDQAISKIQKAIELDDQKDAYFFELGALYERKGDYQRAVEAMERTIALNPSHSNAHNFIGYLLALQGTQLDRALDHLEKALSIQPRNGYFLDSLGWIYYKKGDYNSALEKIKKAMIYVSPDPVLYDHLGEVLFSMHKFSEAHEAWKTSLALTMKKIDDPSGEVPDPAKLKEKIRQTREKMKTR
ncbi:MAG: DUF721 domain-containing protein [Nitrospina sp.]|nr:DUF721 domain-containing protein [Nitrospina sp.]